LSLALLALSLAAGGFTIALSLWTSHLYRQEVQQRMNLDLAEHITKEKLLIQDGVVDEDKLHDVFHMMMVINPSIELYLLDTTGQILSYSAPPGRVQLARVSMEPIEQLLGGPSHLPVLGDDPRNPQRGNIFSVAPVLRQGELEGYLYIVLASEQFASVADLVRGSYILRSATLTLAGAAVVTMVGALLLFGRLTRRLSELSDRMARFKVETLAEPPVAGGGPDPLVSPAPHPDELEQLHATFERMAGRIEEQIHQLEAQDRLRRDMVANVSHDLRTPLAHLQGYLETLRLKEHDLDDERRREYLDIALQHGERLGRLVADLFELAKLDALQEPIERERLPVGELVQDVTQKYRLSASEQGIDLDADLAAGPALISADVGLLERALENVLDNALRHTPRGGRITVVIRPEHEVLCIDVHDTGPGIEDDKLPKIFDRFYRVQESSASDQSRGAGLGLAIAKRAIELHGGSLHCESQIGEGTMFRFELPTAS
jgi:signal transduction histidine kinase